AATCRGARTASTTCSMNLSDTSRWRSIAPATEFLARSSSETSAPTSDGTYAVTCWNGPVSPSRTPTTRTAADPGGKRSACAMFAGNGTVSRDTSLNRVSSLSAIMSSMEPSRRRQPQVPRDHHALDLVRAFVDLRDLRVPHVPLDGVVTRVPVAAEDLDGVGRHPHRRVRREALRHGRLERGRRRALV